VALRIGIVAVVAILLILPWAIQMIRGLLPRMLVGYMQGAASPQLVKEDNQFVPLAQVVPIYLAILAVVGGIWALIRRQPVAILLPWVGCLFLLANPHWLGLPGTGVLNNFTVELSLYIPASILAAYLLVSASEAALRVGRFHLSYRPARLQPVLAVSIGILLATVAWTGLMQRADALDRQFQLVTPADEDALAWVQHNTPEDARFLVNSFFAYGGTLIAGSDAGWWLPLLGHRQNTVPPLNYGGEAGPDPGYAQRVNELTRYLQTSDWDDGSTVRMLRAQGITHIFVGGKGGPLLDVQALQNSPYYQRIYPPNSTGSAGPLVLEVLAP
jgi:hypothetical protein